MILFGFYNQLRFISVMFFLLFFPSISHAAVVMSEIAWMGTSESSYCEWIELFNSGSDDVPLSGWQIAEGGGTTLLFSLSKTIPGNGYLLVERVTPSCPDPVPGINDEAGSFGGSGLSNDGENLVLKDSTGAAVQTLNFGSGWPAGDATTKETMQASGSEWITAVATPDAGISTSGTTSDTTTVGALTVASQEHLTYTPGIIITIPSHVYASVENQYTADVYLTEGKTYAGYFVWNMGDGTVFRNDLLFPIQHSYKYPGTYTVTLNYFHTGAIPGNGPDLSVSKTVSVLSSDISMTTLPDGWVKMQNKLSSPVDVSGWSIETSTQHGVFPEFSLIGGNVTLSIDRRVFGISDMVGPLMLKTPEGMLVATTAPDIVPSETISSVVNKVSEAQTASIMSSDYVATNSVQELLPQEKSIPAKDFSKKNSTRTIVYGAVLLVIIALFILLERVMASQE